MSKIGFYRDNIVPALKTAIGLTAKQSYASHYTSGVLFDLWADGMNLVATDGARIRLWTFDRVWNEGFKPDESGYSFCIDAAWLKSRLPLLAAIGEGGEVVFEFADGEFRVEVGGDVFSTKPIDCKYPDYWRVIGPYVDNQTERAVALNPLLLAGIFGKATAIGLHITSPVEPVAVRQPGEENTIGVIMPIRMD